MKVAAQLLRHRGSGALHYDLVLGQGRRCPTLSLVPPPRRWTATWNLPHRRSWLTRAAPLTGGRGVAERIWRGTAQRHGRAVLLPGAAITWTGARVAITGWLARLPPHGRYRHLHRF
jgi:hypothetical protein